MNRVKPSHASAGADCRVPSGSRRVVMARRLAAGGRWCVALLLAGSLLACAANSTQPQKPLMGSDACSSCRMVLSDIGSAAQIVAPGEEPRFFDDLRCLRDYLSAGTLPGNAIIYVADHRTHAWIEAPRAVFASLPAAETPMGSHLVAYADEDSRKADAGGSATLVPASDVLGPAQAHETEGQGPEEGRRP